MMSEAMEPEVKYKKEVEAKLKRLEILITDITIYVDDIQRVSTALKGDSILRDNMHAYTSAQGSIDVALDLKTLLDGGKITSIDEIKKEQERAKNEEDLKQATPYLQ